MFIKFEKVLENAAIKSYAAEHDGNHLEIDIHRNVSRDGGDNGGELICYLNREKIATFYAKPGSYHEEKTLDQAKRYLVSLITTPNPAAELGKLGGTARTDAKANAARENGKRGGRPRKNADA